MTCKKTLIIADDESTIRLLVSNMLGKSYNILTAANGQEALDVVGQNRPDLILMDIMMPKVDGNTACSTIKRNQATSHIPIIMLTGVGFDLNRKLALMMGADSYLTKPFSLNELLLHVRQFLNEVPAGQTH